MSQKQLDNLYKDFCFKDPQTEEDEEMFAAVAEALDPEAVLRRRLRQSAQQQPEDASQSLHGDQAAASSSGCFNAQGDLVQHRRKKRRNKIDLKEDPYVQYEPPSGAAAKKEPEPESDEEVVNTKFLQDQLKKADVQERRKQLMAEIAPTGKDPK